MFLCCSLLRSIIVCGMQFEWRSVGGFNGGAGDNDNDNDDDDDDDNEDEDELNYCGMGPARA